MSKQHQQEERFTLAPGSIPQQQFLESDSTITLYSGSAGKLCAPLYGNVH